ncbi:MAG TPA: hypothetical protein V6C93_11550 [Allocoleopsis sp.]
MRMTTAELPPEWKDEIEGIAQATGRTSGDVVREALAQYLSATEPLTGQLVHANIASFRQLVVGFCRELDNLVACFSYNLIPTIESFENLLHLLHLYTQYYSSPVPEIQQYAEEADPEFLMEDLPKLLNSLKQGIERIHQICQSYQEFSNEFCLDDGQPEVMKEAIAQYLGKTSLVTNHLVQSETPRLEAIMAGFGHEVSNPTGFIIGNIRYADIYAQDLLQLQTLYAQYYSHPIPEIQEYAERIDLKFLLENLPKLINTLKTDSNIIWECSRNLRTLLLHEKLDLVIKFLLGHQNTSSDCVGIQVIKEYGSIPQLRWNSNQLTSVLITVITLAIHSLEESTASKIESLKRELNLEFTDSELTPALRICTHVNDKNQIIIQIGDYLLQLSLDSEQRLHAEAEPAITWGNGYGLYCYHGVTLPEKYGKLPPREWQAQWILSENNAELRRVLIQGIGYARIFTELQAIELDSWAEYSLLKIDQIIDIDRQPIYLLKMTCPSTGFIHALRVPPNMRSAREAITWVNWGVDPLEFAVQT